MPKADWEGIAHDDGPFIAQHHPRGGKCAEGAIGGMAHIARVQDRRERQFGPLEKPNTQ
jgi:hypothetical protein